MSDMQRLDGSPVHTALGWLPPPSLPMREPTQVLDRGACSWPFLYSYRGDTIVVNKAKQTTKYKEAAAVGFAVF
jgi:hypothetical protein